jgi:hypothetical protein
MIKKLTEKIKNNIDTVVSDEHIRVVDGNQWYFDQGFDEWQVKPKQDGIINEETINLIGEKQCT